MLSGQVRLYDGRTWVTAGPGDFLYVPEGGLHAFRGGGGASMLLMFAPGVPREDYFETLARCEEMTEEQRAAFMLRHDTYWVCGWRPGTTTPLQSACGHLATARSTR